MASRAILVEELISGLTRVFHRVANVLNVGRQLFHAFDVHLLVAALVHVVVETQLVLGDVEKARVAALHLLDDAVA